MSTKFNDSVKIELDNGAAIDADLNIPQTAEAIVIFVDKHPRNEAVAAALHDRQIGTLQKTGSTDDPADIERASARLVQLTAWLRQQEAARNCKFGYFATGAAAAAALRAAAEQPEIGAVVTIDGHPDHAGDEALAQVHAPTLLLVGSNDGEVRRRNEQTEGKLGGTHRVALVTEGTDMLAERAAQWFKDHLLY